MGIYLSVWMVQYITSPSWHTSLKTAQSTRSYLFPGFQKASHRKETNIVWMFLSLLQTRHKYLVNLKKSGLTLKWFDVVTFSLSWWRLAHPFSWMKFVGKPSLIKKQWEKRDRKAAVILSICFKARWVFNSSSSLFECTFGKEKKSSNVLGKTQ